MNGKETEPLRTAANFIALRLEAGEQLISIEPYLSPLRRGLLLLELAWLCAAALYLWRQRAQRHET